MVSFHGGSELTKTGPLDDAQILSPPPNSPAIKSTPESTSLAHKKVHYKLLETCFSL